MSETETILSLDRLNVRLPRGADRTHALRDVSLEIASNEILCVVGESGSGKSMMANAVMRLLPNEVTIDGGNMIFEGRDLCAASVAEMREVRGAGIAMVFQEPMTALNPLRTIGDQIAEMFSIHTDLSKAEINARVLALLADVRIPDPKVAAKAYPHELSGGQRQRAMIAMALALDPKLLIADEPTTALDVTTQAQILKLIRDLQQRRRTAVMFITHDFGVVAEIADRVVVIQHGVIVEQGTAYDVLNKPQHAYTKQLIAAVPPLKAPPPRLLAADNILTITDVSKTYRTGGFLGRGARVTPAVKNVSLNLPRGATLGIVGESGSGKSTLARAVTGLLPPEQGTVTFDGRPLAHRLADRPKEDLRQLQMIYQMADVAMNPRQTVGTIIGRPLEFYFGMRGRARDARVAELLDKIEMGKGFVDRYPAELSGGQKQRVCIARSLAAKPKVPATAGTMPTNNSLFGLLVVGVIVIVAGLTFFPALALGPILEHLSL